MKTKLLSFLLILTMVLAATIPGLAAVEDTGYSDVDANAWYAAATAYCRENGLMSGTSDTAFSPDQTMTRAMLAAVLYRIAGSPEVSGANSFTDVADGAWYSNSIIWAAQEGLVNGYGGGLFGTNDPVSREQIAAILWRYAGSPESEASADFADEDTIATYAASAVDWARANGIISGMAGNLFSSKSTATRAQVATILMNYNSSQQPAPSPTPEPTPTPDSDQKVLVAYFSCTNTTRPLAEYAADALDADLYEIQPEEPYTSADLNYGDDSSRSSVEMNDPAARPAISGAVENMDQYDVVFLGYPIWWGEAPKIISTFLESYDFSGKTIIPFCTSGSSGIGSSATNLQGLTDGSNWLSGQRFGSGASRSDMVAWINGLELGITAK